MTSVMESRVLQDLTNLAEAAIKEAWPEQVAEATPSKAAAAVAAASEPRCCSRPVQPVAPELEMVVECSAELHQLWARFASGGSCSAPFLLHHFAALDAQMLLQPPPAPPPGLSEEVLVFAEAPPPSSPPRGRSSFASAGGSSEQPGCWSEVMRGVAGEEEGSAWRPTPITAQAPERQQCWAFPQRQLPQDPDRLERRLSFEAAANYCSDDSHSSSASHAAAEESPDGSRGDEELVPPSWRQKELCEEELENRLAELLQQEHFGLDVDEDDDDDGFQCWEGGDSAAASSNGGCSCGRGDDSSFLQPEVSGGALSSTGSGPIPEERWNFQTPPRRKSSRRPQAPAAAGVAAAQGSQTQQRPAAASSQPAAAADSWQLLRGDGVGAEKTREVDAVLVDVTKCLLRVFHRDSHRQRPDLDLLLAKVVPAERVQAVDWLLQSCWTLGFPEVVPFAAALYLDKYCLMLPSRLHSDHMQVLYLAVVSIALKMHGTSTQVPAPFREVLSHMGQHRIPVETILEQERQVLAALDFEVSTPTTTELLDLLAAPCDVAPWEEGACGCCHACTYPSIWQLAGFLLRLALREVGLQYRYPPAVLATSAAYLAFWSSQAEGCRPCSAKQGMLLRRLNLACAQPVTTTTSRPRPQVHLSTPSSASTSSSSRERRYHRI